MPKTPKETPETDIDDDARNSGSWGEDQKKREYYYDDAHGYEVYVPDDEEAGKSVDALLIDPKREKNHARDLRTGRYRSRF